MWFAKVVNGALALFVDNYVSGWLLASRIASRMAASSVCTVEQPSDALNDLVVCGATKVVIHKCCLC